MAAKQEPGLFMKILVHREKQVVILAEVSKDFVDTLFSFLSFPVGTVVRLVGKQQDGRPGRPAVIGCMNKLYQSVESLSSDHLWTDTCKSMLLRPRNPLDDHLKHLTMNVDDSVPTRYFKCSDEKCKPSCDKGGNLSAYINARCSCGKLMNTEICVNDSDGVDEAASENDGVFVKGPAMFIVSDDLQVMPSSPVALLQMLTNLGVHDLNQLDEMPVKIDSHGMLKLLKHSLISNSPLTDVFLGETAFGTLNLGPSNSFSTHDVTIPAVNGTKFLVNIMLRKSNNKILYVEARDDFVDFLFSFLAMPLASVVKLLGGGSSLGCMDNLYRSVECLESDWCTKSLYQLLNAGFAPQFGCQNQPLRIFEEDSPQYHSVWFEIKDKAHLNSEVRSVRSGTGTGVVDKSIPLTLIDPRYPDGKTRSIGGFVKRPALYLVSDDLELTPFSSASSISFLKGLEIPIHDLEEYVISISETEALCLLRASLTSDLALTNGLKLALEGARTRRTVL